MEIMLGILAVVAPIIIRAIKNRLANRQPSAPGVPGQDNGPLGLGLRNRLRNRRNPQPAPFVQPGPPAPAQPSPAAPVQPLPLPPGTPTITIPVFVQPPAQLAAEAFRAEDAQAAYADSLCDEVQDAVDRYHRLVEILGKSAIPSEAIAGRIGVTTPAPTNPTNPHSPA